MTPIHSEENIKKGRNVSLDFQRINEKIKENNLINQKKYGNHYINLMAPVMIDEDNVKVFTDDMKYISQDCRHLTQAGAKYYARLFNESFIRIFQINGML